MTESLNQKSELAEFLQRDRDKIIARWADSARDIFSFLEPPIVGLNPEKMVDEDFTYLLGRLNNGVTQTSEGEYRRLIGARIQQGLPIEAVLTYLSLAKTAITPSIHLQLSPDTPEHLDLLRILDAELGQMVGQVGLSFLQAQETQFEEEINQRRLESESLLRTTGALLERLTLDEVLEIVCTEAQQLTGATGSAVLLMDDQDWLRVMISTGTPLPAFERLPVSESLAGKVVRQAKPMLVNEPADQIQAYFRNPNLRAMLVIPLLTKDKTIGVLDVVNKPGGFLNDDLRIMSVFANQAALAIENARLHQQTEELAVVQERQRLARDLHDSVTQAVYTASLYANAAGKALASGKYKVTEDHLNELRTILREAMLNLRLLIFELHPPILEQEGLVKALAARLAAVESRSGIKTDFQVEGERRLPLTIEAEVYRIAQEALANVVKHAKANIVGVNLIISDHDLRLEVRDNGVGFSPQKDSPGAWGLRGMEERVHQIGGNMSIESTIGQGTLLRVIVEI